MCSHIDSVRDFLEFPYLGKVFSLTVVVAMLVIFSLKLDMNCGKILHFEYNGTTQTFKILLQCNIITNLLVNMPQQII